MTNGEQIDYIIVWILIGIDYTSIILICTKYTLRKNPSMFWITFIGGIFAGLLALLVSWHYMDIR